MTVRLAYCEHLDGRVADPFLWILTWEVAMEKILSSASQLSVARAEVSG